MRSRSRLLLASVSALLVCSQSAFAAAPRLTNVMPHGVQRGTEAELTLQGSNLEDAEELLLYDQGMEVVEFKHPEDERQKGRQVTVRLKIAADCPLGTQRMRIRTATGMSDLQNLHVGPLPIVEEVEPNTDFNQPQPIEMNVTVHGRIDREDVDYFSVQAKKGERLSVEVFGTRLGYSTSGNFFDPYVAILNKDRFELEASDDDPLLQNDASVSMIVPEDGEYIIQIRDASYNGDGRAYYLAHIGNFPRPKAVVPSGGKPGETLTVTFLGDVSGAITREVTLPTDVEAFDKRFGLEVADEHGVTPSALPFRLVDLPNTIEVEPNNDRNTATAGPVPGAFNGVISEAGDMDFFKFSATKDQEFDVEVYARRIRTGLDPVLVIYQASDGRQLAANDDSRGPDSYLRFKAPADGDYVLAIYDHLRRGDPTFAYRVEVTPAEPRVEGEPIEFARYVQPTIEIPQGAGSGVVVNVRRENFGGPVNFKSLDLPQGVRIECPEGWRGDGTMPLVFYADEDAPIGGRFSKIVTYHENENRTIEGSLMQNILMVRGQNNNRVWEEQQYRLPIVVTEMAPFRVWIEPPAVPLVRGGSMNLVVRCEKDDEWEGVITEPRRRGRRFSRRDNDTPPAEGEMVKGWDQDISLIVLQNPPGVSSSGSVKIEKGKYEALLPINASGNAPVRESMIAIRCIANIGNGNIELCTAFVPLRVEEEYFKFEFAQSAVEQGKETLMPIKVQKRQDFEGEAEVELLGLPANATAEKVKMTKETEELVFTVKAAENTSPGMNKNILCRVLVPENGETIQHNLGTGVLRVDQPLPPKTNDPKPEPKPVAQTEAPKKPLSRLEMLRQQQKERESGGGGGD